MTSSPCSPSLPSWPRLCKRFSWKARSQTFSSAKTTSDGLLALDSQVLSFRTGRKPAAIDITADVSLFVEGRTDGLVSVFVPHATAGIALIETGAGSDIDLLAHLEWLFPRDSRWQHRHGSSGHGGDHVIPAFVSPSVTIPVVDGRLALGTWQSIVLVDPNVDNEERSVRLSFLD